MKKDKKKYDDVERIRKENEKKREKLISETGCEFFVTEEGKKLNPVIENQFLNNIEEFEKAYDNCRQIALYDFIGRPAYRNAADIPDDEIDSELQKMLSILNENNISLDCLCDVDDRELYRFITEEFFKHEMDDVRIKGMMHCFIYEEFHPNHRYDIENYSEEFINGILNVGDEYFDCGIIDENGFKTRLENFRNSFIGFTVNDFRVLSVDFNPEAGDAEFFLDFSAEIEKESTPLHYSGNGKVDFVFRYGYYYVSSVQLPGFKKM